jgi:hypothetical protein
MLFKMILWLHILAGSLGLILGPIAMGSQKRKGLHTQIGIVYFYLMSLVCLSALILAIMNWNQSWWFSLIAVFSFSFALKGYLAAKKKGKNWLPKHISGMLGSYIAMTTALLIVNVQKIPGSENIHPLVFWFLPTIIGTPLISMTIRKVLK